MPANSATVTSRSQISIGDANDNDTVRQITALENGNYAIAFARGIIFNGENVNEDYYAQLIGSNGQPLSAASFIVNQGRFGSPGASLEPILSLNNGGYVAFYQQGNQSSNTLNLIEYSSAGSPVNTGQVAADFVEFKNFSLSGVSVATLNNGTLATTFADTRDPYPDPLSYSFEVQLRSSGSGTVVVPITTNQSRIDVISDAQTIALAGGGFVVAWTDADGGTQTLYTRVFNAAGQPLAPEQPISASPTDLNGQLTALTGGGYVATYTDDDGAGILAQRFDAQGQAIGSEILVSAVGAEARLDALVNGGFVVAFDAGADHLAAAFDAVGLPIGTTVIDSSSAYGTPDFVLGLPNGGYEVGYFDFTNTSGDVTVVTTTVALAPSNAGTSGPDLLTGTAGSDLLSGEAGNDTLRGAGGDDDLRGGLGNDDLNGGLGNDTVSGGDGNDTVVGADGNDALSGGSGEDQLFGQAGNDTIQAGVGNDKLFGDAGNDQLFGQAGNDTMFGGAGADTLRGDEGNDRLFGDAGMDTLRGGAGDDQLTGGADADVFVFGAADAGQDRILDFTLGADRLDLRGLGLYAEADALSAATSDAAGQVVITVGAVSLTLEHLSIAQLQAGGDFLV